MPTQCKPVMLRPHTLQEARRDCRAPWRPPSLGTASTWSSGTRRTTRRPSTATTPGKQSGAAHRHDNLTWFCQVLVQVSDYFLWNCRWKESSWVYTELNWCLHIFWHIDCSRSSSGAGSPDLWSEPAVFGDRARFIDYGGSQPAVLSISDVSKFHDEGKLAISMTSMKYGSEALSLSFK